MTFSPKDYADIAALAWHVVKGPSDPELPNCQMDHQHRFIFKVESVQTSGKCDENDNGFDKLAQQLLALPNHQVRIAFLASLEAAKYAPSAPAEVPTEEDIFFTGVETYSREDAAFAEMPIYKELEERASAKEEN